jgi:hypothetical protein
MRLTIPPPAGEKRFAPVDRDKNIAAAEPQDVPRQQEPARVRSTLSQALGLVRNMP